MQLIVDIPEGLIKEVQRIHNDESVKNILERKHELSGVYRSIALNVLKAYEKGKE